MLHTHVPSSKAIWVDSNGLCSSLSTDTIETVDLRVRSRSSVTATSELGRRNTTWNFLSRIESRAHGRQLESRISVLGKSDTVGLGSEGRDS